MTLLYWKQVNICSVVDWLKKQQYLLCRGTSGPVSLSPCMPAITWTKLRWIGWNSRRWNPCSSLSFVSLSWLMPDKVGAWQKQTSPLMLSRKLRWVFYHSVPLLIGANFGLNVLQENVLQETMSFLMIQESKNLVIMCLLISFLGSNIWPKWVSGKCWGTWSHLWPGHALRRGQWERQLPCKEEKDPKSFYQIAQGDSGGALTVNGVLAGLVSRGGSDGCAMVTSSLHSGFYLFC